MDPVEEPASVQETDLKELEERGLLVGAAPEEPAVAPAPAPADTVAKGKRVRKDATQKQRLDNKRLSARLQLDENTLSVRAALAQAVKGRVGAITALADGVIELCPHCQKPTGNRKRPDVQVRALELMLKYGLGDPGTVSTDAVRARIVQTVNVIRESTDVIPADQAEVLIERIRRVWT